MIEYRKSSEHLLSAMFCYREDCPSENHAVVPFIAGWNAARHRAEKYNDNYVLVDKGALQMAINVLERNGKQEIVDELRKSCKLVEL